MGGGGGQLPAPGPPLATLGIMSLTESNRIGSKKAWHDQRNGFPPPNYIPLVFGARVDVNLNLIMHHKHYLGAKFPKVPNVGGDTPSHTLPIGVKYINNINGSHPPPPPPLA